MTSRITRTAAAAVVSILSIATAYAGPQTVGTLTVTAQSAVGATASPFLLANPGAGSADVPAALLSTAPVDIGNGATVSFANTQTPNSGVWTGSTSGTAASPFSGTSINQTAYFAAEPNDIVTITFATPVKEFALLWGTVDSYNNLDVAIYSEGILTDHRMVTGDMVKDAVGGGFTAGGTESAFVDLSDTNSFDRLILTSTGSPAFEFVTQEVPEPMSAGLLGGGLMALGIARRRRQRSMAAA